MVNIANKYLTEIDIFWMNLIISYISKFRVYQKQIKIYSTENFDEEENFDLKISRTSLKVFLWVRGNVIEWLAGKLDLLCSSRNYKIVQSFDPLKYQNCILLQTKISHFEIWNIVINNEWDYKEIEFYQKLLKDHETQIEQDIYGILMLIPVKEKISVGEMALGFELSIAILDISDKNNDSLKSQINNDRSRVIYKLKWNWDLYLDELLSLLDEIDDKIYLVVEIERYKISESNLWFSDIMYSKFKYFTKFSNTTILRSFDFENK